MLYSHSPIVFAYYSRLALLKSRRKLQFCIAVAEHCVFELMSFLALALVGESVDSSPTLKDMSNLVEAGVLIPVHKVLREFVFEVGLLAVIQRCKYSFSKA